MSDLQSTISAELFSQFYGGISITNPTKVQEALDAVRIKKLVKTRNELETLLAHYSKELDKVDAYSLILINRHLEQKETVISQLSYTLYLFSLQYAIDVAEKRNYRAAKMKKQMEYCEYLLDKLQRGEIRNPQEQLDAEIAESDKPVAYLGFTIAKQLVDIIYYLVCEKTGISDFIKELRSVKTKTTIELLDTINERRLYWVWSGGMLQSILDILPKTMQYSAQAQASLSLISPFCGYMSWILYFVRMGIQLFMVAKHTINGPWMSDEEALTPWRERFKTQWDQRKFLILNDLIWGFVNMACALWLFGPGMLGYYGNVATTGLLLADLCLNIWRFCEKSTKHNAFIKNLDDEILSLEKNRAIEKKRAEEEEEDVKDAAWFAAMHARITELQNLREDTKKNWLFDKHRLINDVTYAATLLVGFAYMYCMLAPPTMLIPATALIVCLSGAVLCFLLTAATAAISGYLDAEQTNQALIDARKAKETLSIQFKEENDPLSRRLIYLEKMRLESTETYQQELMHFQKIKTIRAMVIDALIPAVIMPAILLMPMGTGIIILIAGLAIIAISRAIVNRWEPQAPSFVDMSEADREKWLADFDAKFEDAFHAEETKKAIPLTFFQSATPVLSKRGNAEDGYEDPSIAQNTVG